MWQPGGEQVRRGCEFFLRTIPSVADLPPAIQQMIQQYQPVASIRQILYVPSQNRLQRHVVWGREFKFGWRRTPPRILVFGTEQVTIIELLDGGTHLIQHIPLADLLMIRLVTVLLYSYFELVWCSGAQNQTIRVEFNSVGMRTVERELNHARIWIASQTTQPAKNAPPEFSVRHFPLKFYNFTRMSLLPGEQIRAAVFEPTIKAAGFLKAALSPNRAVVITGEHLIVVGDQYFGSLDATTAKYRIDRWFCPRAQITQAAFEQQSDAVWLNLSLGSEGYEVRLPLLEPRAAQLQTALEDWLPKMAFQAVSV